MVYWSVMNSLIPRLENGNTVVRIYTALSRFLPSSRDNRITNSDIGTIAATDSTCAVVYKPLHPHQIEHTHLQSSNSQARIPSIERRLEDARDLIRQLESERGSLERSFSASLSICYGI